MASYPVNAATTRFRLDQFRVPLQQRGIELDIRPFISSELFARFYQRNAVSGTVLGLMKSTLRRLTDLPAVRKADVVLIQREAMIFGPPLIEWLTTHFCKRPMLLDLDDATYVSYTSPTYGRVGTAFKWPSKADDLIRWATVVTCGNRAIAEYVSSKGATAHIIPTVVDTEVFKPALDRDPNRPVVLGWIGTHSTFPYLQSILGVFERLAKVCRFRLRIVGAGQERVSIDGVEVENLPWKLEREVEDFQSIDVGLYPIDDSLYSGHWASGKSGFKAIQYMAVGIPYVATPIGGATEIGEPGKTHLCASSPEEWRHALASLISDPAKRKAMGEAGRRHVTEHYGLTAQADKFAEAIKEAAGRS